MYNQLDCDNSPTMNDAITIRHNIIIPPSELWVTASRAGGPGGQHVNTTNSRVSLYWNVRETAVLSPIEKNRVLHRLANRISADGVLQITVDTERSQHKNREIAQNRLAELVKGALAVSKHRIPTKTPRSAKRKRLQAKAKRSAVKRLRTKPHDNDA